jgi:HSP20 family protein
MGCCDDNNQRDEQRANQCTCSYTPSVDISESDSEWLLHADVPGAKAEDIDVEYENGQLTIRARVEPRQNAETRYVVREYGVGGFERSFRIGEGIDVTNIQAKVSGGVLTLHLPKSDDRRSRSINVTAG